MNGVHLCAGKLVGCQSNDHLTIRSRQLKRAGEEFFVSGMQGIECPPDHHFHQETFAARCFMGSAPGASVPSPAMRENILYRYNKQ